MISIVVCSIHPGYLAALKENFSDNIGVEHEWLIWDNRHAGFGLCKVYNMMAEKAQYPYICFVHEDVLIETKDWGKLVVEICEQQSAALVGVAGGKYKSGMFSGWYSGGKELDFYSLTHRTSNRDEVFSNADTWTSTETEVVSIDGVFMFSQTSVWKSIRFNETLLKGFHYYDIDFSLRVAQEQRVLVTKRLNLIHFSKGGDFGDNWVNQTITYHQRIQTLLPFSVASKVERDIDVKVAKYWLDWLKNMNINWRNRKRWILLQHLYKQPRLWYSILKFLLYKPLKLQSLHHKLKKRGT